MSDSGVIDFSVLESAAPAVTDTTPAVDTSVDTQIDTTTTTDVNDGSKVEDAAVVEGKENEVNPLKEDGTPKSAEEITAEKAKAVTTAAEERANPTLKATRQAFKSLRESGADPAALKTIENGIKDGFRWNATKALIGGNGSPSIIKDFLSEVGAKDISEARSTYAESRSMNEAVKATDEMLYSGDGQLWKNVVEDLNASGHPEALGKLAGSFLETLKAHDSTAFYENVAKPNLHQGLLESNYPTVLNSLQKALQSGDSALAGKVLQNMINHWNGLDAEQSEAGKVSKLRKDFEAERAEATKGETEKATKTWEHSVATTADSYSNAALRGALTPLLKMSFFKDFPRETLVDLGNGIKEKLYATLKADKTYQSTMAAYWKGGDNSANNTKIQAFHKQTLDRIANDIVTKVVQNRYPGYAKGGSAAGRVAAAAVKSAADTKAGAASVASGKAIYVATRPAGLIRTDIRVGGRDYTTSDLQTLQIMGKGFVKSTDGKSVRFITWRK